MIREVWIEPVRDWNMVDKALGVLEGLRCELNLWGIETKKFSNFAVKIEFVWIEPVRDWNSSFIKLSSDFHSGVNWTCEGLKLFTLLFLFEFWKVCELNLWGIETLKKSVWGIKPPVWIEPVRDWNLGVGFISFTANSCVNWTCEGLKPLLFLPLDKLN